MEACEVGRKDMMDHALQTGIPVETGQRPTLRDDALILQRAIRYSISTSPGAFLKTVDDVDEKPIDYWEKEILSSTWAVIQRGEEVVGVAAAKWPDREMDSDIEDQATARFVESVWIAPELRGRRIGERLVKYLFEVECEEDPEIRQFLLWVSEENRSAISLYLRMGFKYTRVWQQHRRVGMTELKYRLKFDSAVVKAIETAVNEAARREDWRKFGVRYRILGADTE
jgi:ribosomal protein S18 acetylase RimI-like enzyme